MIYDDLKTIIDGKIANMLIESEKNKTLAKTPCVCAKIVAKTPCVGPDELKNQKS